MAALPAGTVGHFGPELRRFVLAQYHPGQVTVPGSSRNCAIGMAISKRQVVRLLIAGTSWPRRPGASRERGVDHDTGARYKGMNGACIAHRPLILPFATTRGAG